MDPPPSKLATTSTLPFFGAPSDLSALDFVGHGAFHQVLRCPRTDMRVSFSSAGADDAPAILYCLPSFCSRYVGGANYESRARRGGVRVVAVDRPGMGGTQDCEIDRRLEVSAMHVVSVLEYLGIHEIALMAHSAGVIYALHLLLTHPSLFPSLPRLYLTSPWVPTSASHQRSLQLLPSLLVQNQHLLTPSLAPSLQLLGRAFAFSTDLFKSGAERNRDKDFVWPERFRPRPGEGAYEPKPPYHTDVSTDEAVVSCFVRCALSEPLQGASTEYMLCLGRQGPVDEAWYRSTVADIAKQYEEKGRKVMVEVWWAEDDGLIPKKGRQWFDDLLGTAGAGIEYRSCELPGLGHDAPTDKVEVISAIFEDIRESAQSG